MTGVSNCGGIEASRSAHDGEPHKSKHCGDPVAHCTTPCPCSPELLVEPLEAVLLPPLAAPALRFWHAARATGADKGKNSAHRFPRAFKTPP
jgi:hypothetical protein